MFAASILSRTPAAHANAPHLLDALLHDEEGVVRRAAVVAAGRLRHAPLLPVIVNNLEIGYNGLAESMEALIQAGSASLPLLFRASEKPNQSRYVQLRLLHVIRRIGGDEAAAWLCEQVAHPQALVRYEVLRTLDEQPTAALRPSAVMLDQQLHAEVREAAYTLAALLDVAGDTRLGLLQDALKGDLALIRARILRLLAMRYRTESMQSVQAHLTSAAPEKRAYALEVLDGLLGKTWRGLILPLFEQSDPAAQYDALSLHEPQRRLPPLERVRALIGETRPLPAWTLACAYYRLAELGTKHDSALIGQKVNDLTDMIVRETALVALYRLNPTLYTIFQASIEEVQQSARTLLAQTTMATRRSLAREREGETKMLLLIEKVLILRGVSIFADLPEDFLSEVAFHLQEVECAPEQTFIRRGETGNALYIIASGRVRVHDGATTYATLGEREVVGELALLDSEPRTADVTAVEAAKLLKLPQDVFFELLTSSPEMMRGILRVVTQRLRATLARVS